MFSEQYPSAEKPNADECHDQNGLQQVERHGRFLAERWVEPSASMALNKAIRALSLFVGKVHVRQSGILSCALCRASSSNRT